MKADKDIYRQLRGLPAERLWEEEAPRFDRAAPRERLERVAVIRAVGAAFASHGTAAQRAAVRAWLIGLLQDPQEKVRRYALNALPKLSPGAAGEAALLALRQSTPLDREKIYLDRALAKVGGTATLAAAAGGHGLRPQTEQKIKASVARRTAPGAVRLDARLAPDPRLRLHLRCRRGLEGIVRDEVAEFNARRKVFRLADVRRGLVALVPVTPFTLADVYRLRCFGTVNFVLGAAPHPDPGAALEPLAAAITAPWTRQLLTTLTDGALRYRLNFVAHGHQRGAVQRLAERAYTLCPDLLNDARRAPWAIDIYPEGRGLSVELRPRLTPDPRLGYRQDDVPAASHPPLAACLARLAGRQSPEVVWDPFCGSGLELVECALRGGVQRVVGTDLSPQAVAIAQANFAAARIPDTQATFRCGDFHDGAQIAGLGPASVSLVITNPPMGRRIRIPDMRRLFQDFFAVVAAVLRPGGRLVFVNPLRLAPPADALRLQYRQEVDLGGFEGRIEIYSKTP